LDGTYAGVEESIAGFLNRTDLTARIPDFIVLAEAQMQRRFVSRVKQGLSIPRRLMSDLNAVPGAGRRILDPADRLCRGQKLHDHGRRRLGQGIAIYFAG
jgi:hypothetical protein